MLKDVSFTIPEKTSTAIVGPSGSGKTAYHDFVEIRKKAEGWKLS
ncbi:ATP-binding cassette domain-containing protein [Roseburia sp. MSJ-14]|nr:ATP-binding cassette domain-containing protein [Roseburia sp. MSJ-14]